MLIAAPSSSSDILLVELNTGELIVFDVAE